MDKILKFILYARKHPEKELHRRFRASAALNINRDFNWHYEESKCKWVKNLILTDAPIKEVKKSWKKYHKKVCFYDEFYYLARKLLKEGKKKDYKHKWIYDLL